MIDWLQNLLKENQNLALFICIAGGYLIGKVRVGPISLGGVVGTLIVALIVGQSGVALDAEVKTLAFALFIFALGYMAGPAFFANLNRKGLKFGVFTLIEVVSVLAIVSAITWMLDLDQGTAAGVLAGAATESAVVGTATEAIGGLNLPADQIATLQSNVATAYSISYLFGLIVIVLFTSQIAPMLLRINLREEATKLWEKMGGRADRDKGREALPDLVGRLHLVTVAAGRTVHDIEHSLDGGTEVVVEAVRRGGEQVKFDQTTTLQRDDEVLLVGQRTAVLEATQVIGPERAGSGGDDDMDIQLDTKEVMFSHKELNNTSIGDLRDKLTPEERHGVFLTGVRRMDNPMPLQDGTALQSGDVLRLTGRTTAIDKVARRIGFPIDTSLKADFVYLGLGLCVGILIGLLSVTIGGVPVSLGTGGGALLSGLFFGWLRAKHPTFGAFDPAASQVIKDLGLATFIAAVGLSAAPQAIDLIKKYGIALPIAGVLVTLIPACISLYVGKKFLKMEAPILLGGIAGQQCSTPAISAVQTAAGNSTPLIGYTVTYALSNVVLPLLGPAIIVIAGAIN